MRRFATLTVAVVAAIVLFLAVAVAVTAIRRGSRRAGVVRSSAGGFSLWVPEGWRVDQRLPLRKGDSTFLRASEPGVLGQFSRAGVWVARWGTFEGAPFYGDRAAVASLGRVPAQRLTYHRGIGPLPAVGVLSATVTEYRAVIGGSVYQVGFWAIPGPTSWRAEFARMRSSFEAAPAGPWSVAVPRTRLRLTAPAGWVWTTPDAAIGSVGQLVQADDPPQGWAYVFSYDLGAPAALSEAKQSIASHGGYDVVESGATVAGRAVTRLDFRFPLDDHTAQPASYDTEWFVPLKQRCIVVAVATREPSLSTTETLGRSLRIADHAG